MRRVQPNPLTSDARDRPMARQPLSNRRHAVERSRRATGPALGAARRRRSISDTRPVDTTIASDDVLIAWWMARRRPAAQLPDGGRPRRARAPARGPRAFRLCGPSPRLRSLDAPHGERRERAGRQRARSASTEAPTELVGDARQQGRITARRSRFLDGRTASAARAGAERRGVAFRGPRLCGAARRPPTAGRPPPTPKERLVGTPSSRRSRRSTRR